MRRFFPQTSPPNWGAHSFARIMMALALCMGLMALAAPLYGPAGAGGASAFGMGALAAFLFGAALRLLAPHIALLRAGRRGGLAVMLAFWAVTPIFAAIPFYLMNARMGFAAAYFEMVSAFTTTAASAFPDSDVIPTPLYHWRALCAWGGGLFMLCAAVRVLAPLRMAGHETAMAGKARLERAAAAALLLFLHHELGGGRNAGETLESLWGAVFMSISCITTAGFEIEAWSATHGRDGASHAMALLGLAMIGGGAASTAGGLKLMRVRMLTRHGGIELSRLAQPRSVFSLKVNEARGDVRGGAKASAAAIRLAWIFVMLYVSAIGACALALAGVGVDFDQALAASVAALSNTGPVFALNHPSGGDFYAFSASAQLILCAGMVVGRMEVLALLALITQSAVR